MTLGVGVIGANPERGWASISHVPAVQALEGLELRAVATSDAESARRAESAFSAKGYSDPRALIADPAIDVVTVAVRVPAHRELVQAALDGGKHVYCEWPLGRDAAEAEAIRDAANAAGVRVALGLQVRTNPALLRAAEMIRTGAIGRVLGARLYSETIAFGREEGETDAYLEDPANGATLLTIHGGHAIDAAIAVLGPFSDLTALLSTQFPIVKIGDKTLMRSVADDIRLVARLASGAGLSLDVVGGRGKDSTFRFEITGDRAALRLEGGAARGFQSGTLALVFDGETQNVPEPAAAGPPDTAVNVAGVYAALRDDILTGTATAPSFDHAVQLTRLCDEVLASSKAGARRQEAGWPRT